MNPAPRSLDSEKLAQTLAALDRRGFLRAIGIASAIGLLPAAPRAANPLEAGDLQSLTPRTFAILNFAALRVLGRAERELIRSGEIDPARLMDTFLASSPDLVPQARQALLALEFAMPLFSGSLPPFSALEAAQQDRVLGDMRASRFALRRTLFNAVRMFAAIGFYGDGASRPLLGYPKKLGRGEPSIAAAMTYPDDPDFPPPPVPR